jgi:hypothetical protein
MLCGLLVSWILTWSGPDAERRESVVVEVLRWRTPDMLRKRFELRFDVVVLERVGGKNSAGGESGGELGPRVETSWSKVVEHGVNGFVKIAP